MRHEQGSLLLIMLLVLLLATLSSMSALRQTLDIRYLLREESVTQRDFIRAEQTLAAWEARLSQRPSATVSMENPCTCIECLEQSPEGTRLYRLTVQAGQSRVQVYWQRDAAGQGCRLGWTALPNTACPCSK